MAISPEIIRALQEQAEAEDVRESDIVRRVFGVTVKAGSLNEETRSVRVVASSEAIDSYDEIVEQSWNLERYKGNPVVLYNHNRSGMFSSPSAAETLPIGFGSDTQLGADGKLETTLNFVDGKASPLAPMVWESFKQGSIRAVSVGFRSHDIKAEKINGLDVYRLSNNELFEISVVPVPANPEAVARSAELNRQQIKRLHERAVMAIEKEKGADAVPVESKEENEAERLRKELEEVRAKNAELERVANERAAVDRAAEVERAAAQARANAERETESLMNKCAVPAMREALQKLHVLSPELFTELAASLPPITLSSPAVPPEPITPQSTIKQDETADQRLARKLRANKESEK